MLILPFRVYRNQIIVFTLPTFAITRYKAIGPKAVIKALNLDQTRNYDGITYVTRKLCVCPNLLSLYLLAGLFAARELQEGPPNLET